MKMKKLMLLGAIFGSGLFAYNCGGGGGGDTASSGTVGFALTDAYYSGQDLTMVMVNIKEVRMENPATGLSCILFSDQNGITINLPELANSMRLIDVTNCEAGTYTQFSIVVDQQVEISITDPTTGSTSNDVCSIDPNLQINGESAWEDDIQVSCDSQTRICTITVEVEDGGLVVQPDVNNQVALDFEINDSDGDNHSTIVDTTNTNGCSIAFEIEEIEPEEMENHMEQNGKSWEIEGTVANLDANSWIFTLQLDSGLAFTVSYDQNTTIVGNLSNGIRVEVKCSAFDLNNATCQATSIEPEISEI